MPRQSMVLPDEEKTPSKRGSRACVARWYWSEVSRVSDPAECCMPVNLQPEIAACSPDSDLESTDWHAGVDGRRYDERGVPLAPEPGPLPPLPRRASEGGWRAAGGAPAPNAACRPRPHLAPRGGNPLAFGEDRGAGRFSAAAAARGDRGRHRVRLRPVAAGAGRARAGGGARRHGRDRRGGGAGADPRRGRRRVRRYRRGERPRLDRRTG